MLSGRLIGLALCSVRAWRIKRGTEHCRSGACVKLGFVSITPGTRLRFLFFILFAATLLAGSLQPAWSAGQAQRSHSGLSAAHIAVVVNDASLDSQEVGSYYMNARNIPAQNLVHVNIPSNSSKISAGEFMLLKREIESQLSPDIQALVLMWTTPYAVECNSITAALTLGFDAAQCKNTCAVGKPNPYFNSKSTQPYQDFGMRLAMLLPIETVAGAKALIDRGVLSEFRIMPATAYLLMTSDHARNSRARFYPKSGSVPAKQLTIKTMQANALQNEQDIMFYLIGQPIVPNLDSLQFLPGALADHLTSFGGDLLGQHGQMSSLRWLEAGATASYGTVSEPCNHWQKFPHPQALLKYYLSGASAIEAYWKSVAWPAQGLFIGEPLAAPYRH